MDCPKGMKLYSTIYGRVYFEEVRDTGNAMLINVKTVCNKDVFFYPDGKFNTYYTDSEMSLFPSKDVRTWEGFHTPFKDGDIVATENGLWIGITKGGDNERLIPTYCVIKSNGEFETYFDYKEKWQFGRFATEEEKQKLFDAIKANGYRWNAETKTLEKLIVPKFKVGDRIKWKGHDASGRIEDIQDNVYHVDYGYDDGFIRVNLNMQDDYELVPDKFNITSLKPFDKVLVRDKDEHMWFISLFSHYNGLGTYKYTCINSNVYAQCIPYEGNEHLHGKTDRCENFYRSW